MKKQIFMAIGAIALFAQVGCGGSNGNSNNNEDMIGGPQPDLAGPAPDMGTTGCAKPSDTCVTLSTTSTHMDIINACVPANVVKKDITPFYPDHGYTDNHCQLPLAP